MMLFQGRKRGRSEEDDIDYEVEHVEKRYRSTLDEHSSTSTLCAHIPLQTPQLPPLFASPQSGYILTPVHSDSEDNSPLSRTAWEPNFSIRQTDIDMDSDDDDDDDKMTLSPPPEATLPTFARPMRPFRPARLDASRFGNSSANTGRIPTPIHNSFGGGSVTSMPRLNTMGSALRINIGRSRTLPDSQQFYMPSPICESPVVINEPTTPNCSTENMFAGLGMLTTSTEPLEVVDSKGRPRKGRARSGAIMTPKTRFAFDQKEQRENAWPRIPTLSENGTA